MFGLRALITHAVKSVWFGHIPAWSTGNWHFRYRLGKTELTRVIDPVLEYSVVLQTSLTPSDGAVTIEKVRSALTSG